MSWATKRNWAGTTRREVPIDDVRRCFNTVYQRREEDSGIAVMIRDSLAVLIERERIAPVKATDREIVTLPLKIKLIPTAAPTTKAVPAMPRWHRLLYDLEGSWPMAGSRQRACYLAINTWLLSNPDRTTLVPLRERALEIFSASGDEETFPSPEKALDDVRKGPLFSDQERLLDLLHATATPPPLLSKQVLEELNENHLKRVGDGDLLLVVENSATWWSVVKALPASHNVGHVAWGLGGSFVSSVRSITESREIRRIRYFGDVDSSGLRIPVSAKRTAQATGLPPVRPATHLYAELFTVGRSWRAGDMAVSEDRAAELSNWLPGEHREIATNLLVQGRRIAQEWVGYQHLSRTQRWHADLI
ncbi:Wadjet anti-phage system protein JetD domain-containing protein [Frankia tisae]|uniref:Wadjet anti-phage system protein JetD domain-containing protein n=1 Tax=Frankia tisae TaxID=2950104 RepID=UPI0021BF3D4F|nr:Wadjet anti-phage system protein JetD domain-containing protein [Frankia tisae]